MKPQYDKKYLDTLQVRYIGQQERTKQYSLDLFTDLITGTTFLRLPFESLEAAITRTRARYGKPEFTQMFGKLTGMGG